MEHNHHDYQARIENACRFLEDRLDEDTPLEEIAKAAHFSPFHFHRLFRGLTGETVRGYTRRLRLERAAHRLVHSDEDILPIALDLGYGSHEAFTRAFKKQLGLTPTEYRAAKRDAIPAFTKKNIATVEVRIEKREPCVLARVRHIGPYTGVGVAWQTLMKWGWSKMIFGSPDTFGQIGRAHV